MNEHSSETVSGNASETGPFRWTSRSILWTLLTAAYSVTVVLMHRQANLMAGRLSELWGMSLYLFGSRVVAVIGGILVLLLLIRGRGLFESRTRLLSLLVFLPVAAVFDQALISVPIERIHYPQYALLAWMAYKATGRPFSAVMIAFLVGYADETFQYFVLYASDRFVYFDWNDILLNLTAALGVLLFFLPEIPPPREFPRKKVIRGLLIWVASVGLVTTLWDPDRYLLGNQGDAFWVVTNIDTTYHVVKAREGLLLLGMILIVAVGYYMAPRRSAILPVAQGVDGDAGESP